MLRYDDVSYKCVVFFWGGGGLDFIMAKVLLCSVTDNTSSCKEIIQVFEKFVSTFCNP